MVCSHDRQQPRFTDLPEPLSQCDPGAARYFTYIRITVGFCYLAVILDACSRKVVGYALSRRLDTPLALAALHSAIDNRKPPPGCIHHTDRGCQGRFNRSPQHPKHGRCLL
ncbi:DDE-type integrase/transposase/recombinase (plasmid) [Agrobacterium radiobacter]|uniref:DDE-type integrase/transposase/recombinase n=1 Tax=Agrobacterium tumefaciens complex TaxID=1183400 RepID=UPI00366EEFD8